MVTLRAAPFVLQADEVSSDLGPPSSFPGLEAVMVDTISDLDAQLDRARATYLAAEERGDLDAANLAYGQLDRLLERRFACPQSLPAPRPPSG